MSSFLNGDRRKALVAQKLPVEQDDAFHSQFAVSIPLRPRDRPVEAFPSSFDDAVFTEYLTRYLERLGVEPSPQAFRMLQRDMRRDRLRVTHAWRSRGSQRDQVNMVPAANKSRFTSLRRQADVVYGRESLALRRVDRDSGGQVASGAVSSQVTRNEAGVFSHFYRSRGLPSDATVRAAADIPFSKSKWRLAKRTGRRRTATRTTTTNTTTNSSGAPAANKALLTRAGRMRVRQRLAASRHTQSLPALKTRFSAAAQSYQDEQDAIARERRSFNSTLREEKRMRRAKKTKKKGDDEASLVMVRRVLSLFREADAKAAQVLKNSYFNGDAAPLARPVDRSPQARTLIHQFLAMFDDDQARRQCLSARERQRVGALLEGADVVGVVEALCEFVAARLFWPFFNDDGDGDDDEIANSAAAFRVLYSKLLEAKMKRVVPALPLLVDAACYVCKHYLHVAFARWFSAGRRLAEAAEAEMTRLVEVHLRLAGADVCAEPFPDAPHLKQLFLHGLLDQRHAYATSGGHGGGATLVNAVGAYVRDVAWRSANKKKK